MRVLVTGVAGFIGSHLAEHLVAEGHEVMGVDSFTEYYDPAIKWANLSSLQGGQTFRLVGADLATADLGPLVEACDVVCHLAGQPGVRESWGTGFPFYLERNILATQRLLEAVREQPLRRLIFASSSSVYGESRGFPASEEDLPRPISPYGVTKLAAEQLCLAYHAKFGVPTVVLRYFTVYGPRQRPDMAIAKFIRSIAAGEPVRLNGQGNQTRDFTFVTDVVAATTAAIEADVVGQVLNVASGSNETVFEVTKELGRIMQRQIAWDWYPEQPGDVRDTWADLKRANRALGYSSSVGLSDGLRAQVAWTQDLFAKPSPAAT